jgi:hypothetical protein
MFLDYLALALIFLSIIVVFYTFIYIHDLPHKIAKEREHPHEEAIHVACWLSLFTLHAMWPLVFTWAVSHKKQPHTEGELAARHAAIEERLAKAESTPK